jgi:hypothetical protein
MIQIQNYSEVTKVQMTRLKEADSLRGMNNITEK